ncbi:uncharacterized protein LOC116172240 [Photinus pyralis]|uniref:uncharacterized protein LOC116172240 n=1 Tax=Photinus pyralis TaxID=7054 RepID=UPI001267349D|nr:uncharacterized protein LOC116172240 [Photinus pyralis]
MSLQSFIIFATLVFGVFAETPYSMCATNINGVRIDQFNVNNCTITPCQFKISSPINFALNFSAIIDIGNALTQPVISVYRLILLDISALVYQNSLCSMINCPIYKGTIGVGLTWGTTLGINTPGTYTVQVSIVDDLQTVLCTRLKVQLTL